MPTYLNPSTTGQKQRNEKRKPAQYSTTLSPFFERLCTEVNTSSLQNKIAKVSTLRTVKQMD